MDLRDLRLAVSGILCQVIADLRRILQEILSLRCVYGGHDLVLSVVRQQETERPVQFSLPVFCVQQACRPGACHSPVPVDLCRSRIYEQGVVDLPRVVIAALQDQQLRVREFLDTDIYSDAMLNNVLGPVCFYNLKDGNVDAAFVTAGYPTAAIQDIASQRKVRLIPVDADKAKALIAKYPFYTATKIPASVTSNPAHCRGPGCCSPSATSSK